MTVAPDLTVAGVAIVIASWAILCPDCLGDWCASCGWSGLSRPKRAGVRRLSGDPELPAERAA